MMVNGKEVPAGSVPSLVDNQTAINEKLDKPISGDLDSLFNQAINDEKSAGINSAGMAPPGIDQSKSANIAGWKVAVMQVVPMVEAMIPEMKSHVKAPQWDAFGQALGEVMDYYGIGLGDAFNHPLAKLAIAAFPIGAAAFQIKKERLALAVSQEKPKPKLEDSQEKKSDPIPPKQNPGSVTNPDVVSSEHPGVTVRNMDASQNA